MCFNWGVTDFAATDELVWGFLRGHQVFWMEPEAKSAMLGFYEVEDRDIYEQTVPLSPDAARGIENKVLAQLDGPWRNYIYDHFFDNCTTRIRDLIDAATDGALRAGTDRAYPLTFRELGYRGIAEHPMLRGLSDFLVGRALDAHPTVWQAMFHPDVLRQEIAAQLGVAPKRLGTRTGPPFPQSGPSGALADARDRDDLRVAAGPRAVVATLRARGARVGDRVARRLGRDHLDARRDLWHPRHSLQRGRARAGAVRHRRCRSSRHLGASATRAGASSACCGLGAVRDRRAAPAVVGAADLGGHSADRSRRDSRRQLVGRKRVEHLRAAQPGTPCERDGPAHGVKAADRVRVARHDERNPARGRATRELRRHVEPIRIAVELERDARLGGDVEHFVDP